MPQYLPYILQAMQQNELQKKQDENNQWNPLASIVGLGAGLLGGGGLPAALLGAISGMGATKGQGAAGIAQAGLGGYQFGTQMGEKDLKNKFIDRLMGKGDPLTNQEKFGYFMKYYPEEIMKSVLTEKQSPMVQIGPGSTEITQSRNPLLELFRNTILGTGRTIKVMSPDGKIGEIPEEDWAEAQKTGYTRLP